MVSWHIVGKRQIHGRQAFQATLAEMKANRVSMLTIKKIITHGKEGAVNGELVMEDGKTYAFCDVYEFAGAKGKQIKTITSYVIETETRSYEERENP